LIFCIFVFFICFYKKISQQKSAYNGKFSNHNIRVGNFTVVDSCTTKAMVWINCEKPRCGFSASKRKRISKEIVGGQTSEEGAGSRRGAALDNSNC